jgi:hypothetical protein
MKKTCNEIAGGFASFTKSPGRTFCERGEKNV